MNVENSRRHESMFSKTLMRALCCLFVVTFACGVLVAQELKVAPKPNHVTLVAPYVDHSLPPANVTIFTNLGPTATNNYNAAAGGYYVSGPNAIDNPTDQWIAIPFLNKQADHATQIQAAIGWISGTKKVNLGIYTDNAGVVGTMLAQASTTRIPTSGTCCQLAQVNIPSTALAANTTYWVVATTDDVAAPDFEAVWQPSNQANIGADVAQGGWFTFSGLVPAVAVKGTNP
jgi:hypothetical protein